MDYLENLQKAEQLIELGRYKDAINLLQDDLANSPFKSTIYEYLIACYLELENDNKSKKLLDIALNEFPNNDTLHYYYSLYYNNQSDFSKAIKHVKIAIELEPDSVTYLSHIAFLHIKTEQLIKAEHYLEEAEQIDPNYIDVLQVKALIAISKGKKAEGIKYLDEALAIKPNSSTLLALRSRVLVENPGDIGMSEEAAYQALEANPNDELAKGALLEVLRNKNKILRFFVGNSFNQYQMEWTVGRVILLIICWKGVFIWGGFFILYLLVTWYGGVLFNTITRLHHKYKYLLSKTDIKQSNLFIGMNGILILAALARFFPNIDSSYNISLLISILSILLISISYFEITRKKGRIQFYIFGAIALSVLYASSATAFGLAIAAILLLLVYAFFFTLRIAF